MAFAQENAVVTEGFHALCAGVYFIDVYDATVHYEG